ncbi:MAG: pyridoxal phosphate-dependent aminotransferase [Ignavibacteriales bacterium]
MTQDTQKARHPKTGQEQIVSSLAREIPPFIAMDVLERAKALEREGVRVIHLEVGEPDFDTPEPVIEVAKRALASGQTHYTHSLGVLELREEIARHYERRYGVTVSPDQIIVTSGTSPALMLVFAAVCNPGDEVIISDPHYACYPNAIRAAGGAPVKVPVAEQDGFRFRVEDLRKGITPQTKAILINSPANPTGTLFRPDDLAAIAGVEPLIVSDEIYHGLVYGDREHTILEYTDHAVVINGFSKLYAMTGWRLGYVIVPPELVRPVQKLQQNLFICAAAFSQYAAIAALRECGEHTARMVRTYDERRRHMLRRLREIGLKVAVEPTGAFYILANCRHISADSYALAFDILEKSGVAVTPGIDFGANAEGFLRFSYANSIENIEEAMGRLERYLDKRDRRPGL